jgi:hypothetical protein
VIGRLAGVRRPEAQGTHTFSASPPDGTAARAAVASDVPFILDSWLRSFRSSPWAGVVRNDDYHETYRRTVEGLLARGARIRVLAEEADPARIVAWCASEQADGAPVVHYLLTRPGGRWRRRGAARHLLAELGGPGYYTFRTPDAAHFPGWRHRPELARRK